MISKRPFFQLLSEYQPVPGRRFYQKMENAPWKQPEEKKAHRSTSLRRLGWQITVAALLVLALISLSIPAVRASISAWLGFSVAPSDQMPAPTVNLIGITPPTPAGTQSSPEQENTAAQATEDNRPAEISQLDSQAGWQILAPAYLPAEYRFQSAYFDANQQMVILTYTAARALPDSTDPALTETKSITLLQAQRNDFVPLQAAPSANITDVQVGGQNAAYAVGAWDTAFVKDENDPNGGKMLSTWRNDLPAQNLFGQIGPLYYVLITNDTAVSQQDLINMAASLGGE